MLIKPVISINIISHFSSGKIWTALDVNSIYNLDQDSCERLEHKQLFNISLAGLKLACRTDPRCNTIQFNPKNNDFRFFKCPIPSHLTSDSSELPLTPDSIEFEIHVFSDSKCKNYQFLIIPSKIKIVYSSNNQK